VSAARAAVEAYTGRLKPQAPTVTDPALLEVCREIVSVFGHLDIRMEHVYDLVREKMRDAKPTTQVKLLTESLDTYEVAAKNPTITIDNHWNYFGGILGKKVPVARAAAEKEPKTYIAPPEPSLPSIGPHPWKPSPPCRSRTRPPCAKKPWPSRA